jgi:hypothetical protein
MSAKVKVIVSAEASAKASKGSPEAVAQFTCHLCQKEYKSSAGFTKHLKTCIEKKDIEKKNQTKLGEVKKSKPLKAAKKEAATPPAPLKHPPVRTPSIIQLDNSPDPIRKYADIYADLLLLNPGVAEEAAEKTAKEMIKEAEEEDAVKKYETDVKRQYEKIYANLLAMNGGSANKEILQKVARDQAHEAVEDERKNGHTRRMMSALGIHNLGGWQESGPRTEDKQNKGIQGGPKQVEYMNDLLRF